MDRYWYVASNRLPVTWETAVVGGQATLDIYELRSRDGAAVTEHQWALTGAAVSDSQVAAAQRLKSSDPVPEVRVAPTSPEDPDVQGGGAGMTRTGTAAPLTTGYKVVPLNTVERQAAGYTCDTTAGTITVADEGWHVVSGSAAFQVAISGYSQCYVASAGEYVVRGDKRSAATSNVACSGAVWLAAGTVLSLNVELPTNATIDTGSSTFMRVVRL